VVQYCQRATRGTGPNQEYPQHPGYDGRCRDSACDYAPFNCEVVPVARIEQIRCCSLTKGKKEAASSQTCSKGSCFEEDHNPRFNLALLNNICASTRWQRRSRVLWRRPPYLQPRQHLHRWLRVIAQGGHYVNASTGNRYGTHQ